jgi:hypothetical protein
VPDFEPRDSGEKVTLIVQCAPAATPVPQVEVDANWPVVFMVEIFSSVLPVLVSVTDCAALLVPIFCCLKFSGVVGYRLTTPVLSRTNCCDPSWSVTVMSGMWSPLKSAIATEPGNSPVG